MLDTQNREQKKGPFDWKSGINDLRQINMHQSKYSEYGIVRLRWVAQVRLDHPASRYHPPLYVSISFPALSLLYIPFIMQNKATFSDIKGQVRNVSLLLTEKCEMKIGAHPQLVGNDPLNLQNPLSPRV
jgi:hypothetical protein